MKITSVDAMILPTGNGQATSRGSWCPIVLRINTDEGIYGWGEAGLAFGKGWRAALGIIQDFSEQILEMDPLNIEQIWETLFRKTFWGLGGGTVISAAMSAIDIALYDIKGKALKVPAYQLLGGKCNDNLRAYASQLQFNWGTNVSKQRLDEPEEYADVTRRVMEEGYDCVKVDPVIVPDNSGKSWNIRGPLEKHVLQAAYDRIAAVRAAGGEDLDIIIELHSNTDTVSAIQLAELLKPLRIFYYEEPAHPLNVENFTEIKKATTIPLASGERIYTRHGYRPYFEKRLLDVVQPDLCLCGGLSEAKKICDMAWIYDSSVQIHVCGSPISKAAALQIEAAIPNFLIHEHNARALYPSNRESCIYDYQPVNGRYKVPDLPGIGQEPTADCLKRAEIFTVAKRDTYFKY